MIGVAISRQAGWFSRWLIVATLLSALTGCGTDEYDRRFQDSVQKLESAERDRKALAAQGAKFNGLDYGVVQLNPTPVKIRIPLLFRGGKQLADSGDKTGVPAPKHMQPVFATQPGQLIVYENVLQDPAGKEIPLSCHLSVVPTKGTEIKWPNPDQTVNLLAAGEKQDADHPLATAIMTELQAAFPKDNLAWEDVEVETPDLKTIPWKRVTVKTEQPFGVIVKPKQGEPPFVLPGTAQFYVYESPQYRVVMTWRVPDVIANQHPWEELALRMAGSLQAPQGEAAAPAVKEAAAPKPGATTKPAPARKED